MGLGNLDFLDFAWFGLIWLFWLVGGLYEMVPGGLGVGLDFLAWGRVFLVCGLLIYFAFSVVRIGCRFRGL